MAKEQRQIIREAMDDAKALRSAAQAAAEAKIVETLAPAVKRLVEKELRGAIATEKRGVTGRDNQSQRADYLSQKTREFEEDKEKGEQPMPMDKDAKKGQEDELDLESLMGMFPQLSEEPDPAEQDPAACPPKGMPQQDEAGMMMQQIPMLGEEPEADPEHQQDDKPAAFEEVEISEEALRQVYEAALQTEAQVSKGFSDMKGGGELADATKETGIADKKSGDHEWNTVEPSDKKDFTVKEAIERGMAENKQLRRNLGEAYGAIKKMAKKLSEVNLFNAKVMHVNRLLTKQRLTTEQKKVVLENIDKAKTIEQVKMVYETILSSFKAASTISESRKPSANAQRARTSGTPKHEVLSESVDRSSQGGGKYSRWTELAGLTK